ncbi:MAG TPA: hypothetical protein V6D22_08660 [Candidatus Obscuribacterales bacterium]
MQQRSRRRQKATKGAILVESALSLFVIFTVFIGSVLLLLNVGVVIYYKMKLATVTTQTAAYAASLVTPSTLTFVHNQTVGANYSAATTAVTGYANAALNTVGLTGSGAPSVTVNYSPLDGDVLWVNVFITVSGVPLVGNGTILPAKLDLTDTACSIARYDQTPVNNQFIIHGTTPAPPGGQDASLYMPGYGWVPGGNSGAPNYDVMNLRSSYFSTSPTIIPMAIPSTGDGYFSEYVDTGGPTMTVLPGGTSSY